MKRLLLIILSISVLFSCGPSKPTELTSNQLAKEKERVIEVIKQYNKAFEEKKFSAIVPTLAEDVVFFGSDSSEVIKSLTDFKKMIQTQWDNTDMKYGNMFDEMVMMDNNGTIASVVYGMPATVTVAGQTYNYFFRVSRTLKKVDGRWLIANGIVGITQQSPKATEGKPLDTNTVKQ